MTRQRFEGLRMELSRRALVKFDEKKTNKMGKVFAHQRDTRVNFDECRKNGLNSYDDIWNIAFKSLRESVGM